ncbi:Lrp/AsnC family transcriptional regulator [uncultured Cocleimonas sp.]|uniref:Lrp/AsnC family transcriptional regulator n=1 Tax=uncultured Cocleimonas sp. TaxID=1051587 RepID=UPI00260F2715|nr:Lrp/AsnC family transcriptional regulator [uncultured Cocleimonas sp.]
MIDLSEQDIKILKLLQSDADRSSSDIAEILNMSQSPCWRRINQLIQKDIINKKVAVLNREKLGIDLVAFSTINLRETRRRHLEEFEDRVKEFEEVVECYTMTGSWDYMLKIVVRDIRQYEKFVRSKLLELPMIGEVHSHLAVTEIKNTTELPLNTQL